MLIFGAQVPGAQYSFSLFKTVRNTFLFKNVTHIFVVIYMFSIPPQLRCAAVARRGSIDTPFSRNRKIRHHWILYTNVYSLVVQLFGTVAVWFECRVSLKGRIRFVVRSYDPSCIGESVIGGWLVGYSGILPFQKSSIITFTHQSITIFFPATTSCYGHRSYDHVQFHCIFRQDQLDQE